MIYNFKCPSCKVEVEIKESMVNIEKLRPFCSKCDSKLERVYNAPSIHFLGKDWTKGAKK